MRIARPIIALMFGLALLSACGKSKIPWHGDDITGVMPDLAFQLTDEDGQAVTQQQYRGKVVLLYFGYTHCPDVCPTTLATLALALRKLNPGQVDRVRVLFVSVDPKRDSPAVLKEYTKAFAPQVVGLTGNQDQLEALAKRYRVSYSYGKPDEDGNYDVYHSNAIFVFDGDGDVRLLARESDGGAGIAQDLIRLLTEPG